MTIRYTWPRYLRELLPFAVPVKRTIFAVVLFTLISVCLDLLDPIIYKHVLNDLSGVFVHQTISDSATVTKKELRERTTIPHSHTQIQPRTVTQAFRTLILASVLMFIINVLSYFFYLLSDYWSARYSSLIEQDFIGRLFRHVLTFRLDFFGKNTTASLAKKIDQTDQVGPAISSIVERVSTEAFKLVGASAIMFYHSTTLATVSLVTIPFYILISIRMARRLEGQSEEYLEKWDDVATKLQDHLIHIKTVKTSGAENRVVKKFTDSLRGALTQYLARSKQENTYEFFQNLCINGGRLIILITGSYGVYNHRMTPGEIVMFVALLDQMYDPINALTSNLVNLQVEKVSITRGLSLFHVRGEPEGGEDREIVHPTVEFQHVNFGYKKERIVLEDLSFSLPAFTYSALVGPSGSGKSTIIDLIQRFYSPQSGNIFIGETEIRKLSLPGLRSQIGVVAADGAVFRGTLRENILYKRGEASDEEVQRTVDEAGLRRAVDRLPAGLESEVGDQGLGLSLGERQRLQFARMLIARPRLILLDEATANLDYETENEIRNILRKLRKTATILVVGHRFSMVEDASNVLVLDGGRIQASGTIEEVKEKNEWFRNLALRTKKN